MNKLDIILFVTAWVSIIMVLVMCKKENDGKKNKPQKYYCIYNDMTKCYEKCCNDCEVKSECDYCCGGECERCEGRKVRK